MDGELDDADRRADHGRPGRAPRHAHRTTVALTRWPCRREARSATRAAPRTRRRGRVRGLDPVTGRSSRRPTSARVQVLKHGNLFLLTDPFGDIHPDSAASACTTATRALLSCSMLRVNGERPVLLQASAGGNYRGDDPADQPDGSTATPTTKVRPARRPRRRRSSGIARDRLLGARRRSRSASGSSTTPSDAETVDDRRSSSAIDAADIFEVRGCRATERGTLLPDRRDRPTGSRSATTASTAAGARRTSRFSEPADDGRAGRTAVATAPSPGPASGSAGRWPLAPGPSDASCAGSSGRRRGRRAGARPRRPTARPTRCSREPPRIAADEARGAVPRLGRGARPTVETDHELFNLAIKRSRRRPAAAGQRRPGRGRALHRRRRAVVQRRCSAATRSSPALQALAFRPQIARRDARGARGATRRPRSTTWRDAEPGKILHELRTGEMARAGELPHTPYYGTRRLDAAVADPARRDVRLDRRPRAGRPAVAERAAPRSTGSTDYGDRDGDGFVEYERRSRARPAQPGLEGLGRRDPRPRRPARPTPRSRWPRSRATSSTPSAGWPASPAMRGDDGARRRGSTPRPTTLRDAVRGGVLGRGPALLRDGARRRQAPGRRDRRRTPASACGPGSSPPERAARRRRAAAGARRCSRGWGIRTYAVGPAGLQPDRLPHRHGLAARHALIAAGLKRYGFHDEANRLVGRIFEAAQRFPDFRLPELFCGFDRDDVAASRSPTRSPARRRRGRPARRSCSSRRCSGCAPHADRRRARAAPPAPARLARQGHAHQPARRRRVGRPAVPPLARHDERGGPAQGRRRRRHDPALIATPAR